jgi:PAS domain S-box-containing protein
MAAETRSTILLVEDSAFLAMIRRDSLTNAGYNVLTARNGERAVELVEAGTPIDIILMDVELGEGMDGTEAAARIMRQRDIPVLFLSSHTDKEIVERTERITSYGYVVKDSSDVVLVASIKMAFKLHTEKLAVQARQREIEQINRELEASIAERKRAEERAAELSDFRERVFNSIDARLAVVMPDGIINEVNDSWRRFAVENGGGDESQWGKGALYFRTSRPEAGDTTSAEQAYDGLRRVQRGDLDFFSMEYPCHPPDSKRWYVMRVMPLKGRPGTVLVSHTDITAAWEVRAALEQSETLFRNVFQKHTAVKLILDPVTGNVLDANEAAVTFYGWTREQLLQMRIMDINTLSADEVKAELAKVKNLGRTTFEFRHRRADGTIRDVGVYASAIGTGGRSVVHSIITDITDRKRAEREREEAIEAVRQQLAEKNLLLRETHHRIKNNIASIGHLLSLQAQSTTNPEVLGALQDAAARVSGMRVLYDRMLMADRYQEADLDTYLGGLVESVVGLLAGETRVTVEKSIGQVTLGSKELFPLGLIVNEIVTNMIKHAFAGRAAGTVRISGSAEGNVVTLVLEDDGMGLPQGFSVEDSKGFGLTLVQMLCGQLDAKLTVDSCASGTRWTIVFEAESVGATKDVPEA